VPDGDNAIQGIARAETQSLLPAHLQLHRACEEDEAAPLQAKSTPMVFLGYEAVSKANRLFNSRAQVVVFGDVVFNRVSCWYWESGEGEVMLGGMNSSFTVEYTQYSDAGELAQGEGGAQSPGGASPVSPTLPQSLAKVDTIVPPSSLAGNHFMSPPPVVPLTSTPATMASPFDSMQWTTSLVTQGHLGRWIACSTTSSCIWAAQRSHPSSRRRSRSAGRSRCWRWQQLRKMRPGSSLIR